MKITAKIGIEKTRYMYPIFIHSKPDDCQGIKEDLIGDATKYKGYERKVKTEKLKGRRLQRNINDELSSSDQET
jgi:hypothetical protein